MKSRITFILFALVAIFLTKISWDLLAQGEFSAPMQETDLSSSY